jgi:hypothetical protein
MRIFYNLDDLGDYVNKIDKKVGIWSIGNHGEIHDGHRKCYEAVKNNSEFIIGLIANTWLLQIAKISEHPILPVILPISKTAIKELEEKCNTIMIYDNKYTAFLKPKRLLKWAKESLPISTLPSFISENELIMDSLRAAQMFKRTLNEKIKYSYHCGSLKDPWRFYYARWQNEIWKDRFYDLIEPSSDEYGQSISDSYPKSLREQINKPLLLKGMRTIEDLQQNIKDIEGLTILYFVYDPNTKYILARFCHNDFPNKWWNVGLKDE